MLRFWNAFFLLVFLYAAAVQYNDPDPVRWMVIYLGAALACLFQLVGRPLRWFSLLVATAALIWALIWLAPVLRERALTADEIQREFMGLLLVCVWMGYLSWRSFRRS